MAGRRGRGEGTIIQRHDHKSCPPLQEIIDADGKVKKVRPKHTCKGRWAKVIDLGWSAGTRQRRTIYGSTKQDVIDKAATFQGGAVSAYTVETWMLYWLETIAPQRCRPQTLTSYRSKIRAYIIPLLGKHRLDALEPEHIEAMYDRMRKPCPRVDPETEKCTHSPSHGLAEASIRQTHAILARGLEIALRRKKVGVNAAKMLDAPATTTAKRDRLTVAEAKLVLAVADKEPNPARWWCALMLGMRQGECLGLPWAMVDFEANTLTVARTLIKVDGGVTFGEPKSRSSKRVLPLPSFVRDRLFAEWNKYVESCDGEPDLSRLVWCQPDGQPIGHRVDWKRWSRILDQAGVRHVTLHSARNTTAGLLEDAGVPPRLAAEITGHGDVKMLYEYQDGGALEGRRNAIAAIEQHWEIDDEAS